MKCLKVNQLRLQDSQVKVIQMLMAKKKKKYKMKRKMSDSDSGSDSDRSERHYMSIAKGEAVQRDQEARSTRRVLRLV